MDSTLEIVQDVVVLAMRTAIANPSPSIYNPYPSATTSVSAALSTTSSMPGMSMTGMSGVEPSFFEKYKTFIIGAAIGLPLQIAGGWFYWRRRKAKKAAAKLEKDILESRLKELEMGLLGMKPAPKVPYEQVNVYAGSKMV